MAIFLRLLPSHVSFGSGQIGGFPIGPILVDCWLKLTDLLGSSIEFEFSHSINVYVVVGFLRRGIEEIHLRNSEGLQALLQALIWKIKPELRCTHSIDRVKGRHPMVGFVPSLIPLAGIGA